MRSKGLWQVQAAKARFSEVFELARSVGPQTVTRRGKDAVVIISVEEYRKLTRRGRRARSLYELITNSPLKGVDLDLERSRDVGREVNL